MKTSEAGLSIITSNLRDLGNEMVWRTVDTDLCQNISRSLKAYTEEHMMPLYVIDCGLKALSRIAVFERDTKAKLVDLAFAVEPITYI